MCGTCVTTASTTATSSHTSTGTVTPATTATSTATSTVRLCRHRPSDDETFNSRPAETRDPKSCYTFLLPFFGCNNKWGAAGNAVLVSELCPVQCSDCPTTATTTMTTTATTTATETLTTGALEALVSCHRGPGEPARHYFKGGRGPADCRKHARKLNRVLLKVTGAPGTMTCDGLPLLANATAAGKPASAADKGSLSRRFLRWASQSDCESSIEHLNAAVGNYVQRYTRSRTLPGTAALVCAGGGYFALTSSPAFTSDCDVAAGGLNAAINKGQTGDHALLYTSTATSTPTSTPATTATLSGVTTPTSTPTTTASTAVPGCAALDSPVCANFKEKDCRLSDDDFNAIDMCPEKCGLCVYTTSTTETTTRTTTVFVNATAALPASGDGGSSAVVPVVVVLLLLGLAAVGGFLYYRFVWLAAQGDASEAVPEHGVVFNNISDVAPPARSAEAPAGPGGSSRPASSRPDPASSAAASEGAAESSGRRKPSTEYDGGVGGVDFSSILAGAQS